MPRWRSGALVALLVVSGVLVLVLLGLLVVQGRPVVQGSGDGDPASSTPEPRPPSDAPTGATPRPGGTLAPCPDGARSWLTVLSFNIHGGVGPGGYDLAQVAAEIEAWDPDVALLQEVHRFRAESGLDDQPAVLEQLTGMRAVFGANFTEPAEAAGFPRRQSGTAVLSDLPVVGHRNTLLPNRPGKQQRGLLRVTVRLDGREVDLYGTHLDHTRGTIRLVQARGIRRVLERRDPTGARPFVLGGDFNTEPDSLAMDVVRGYAVDPWPRVGQGEGDTVLPREPRRRIDYVLHGPGWTGVDAETLLSQVSDHRALRTTLELEPDC